jgi:hypothetical protein
MKESFTRDELYQLVWSQPLRTIAHEMGISDVALAKTCRKANIPVPPRGYWARKQAGRAAAVSPLPPRFPAASDTIGSERGHYYSGPDWRERILAAPIPEVPVFDEDIDALTKRVKAMVGRVEFSQSFDRRHPLVDHLLKLDDERKAEYARYKSSYYAPRHQAGAGLRWLTILNSLFLALQRLGCSVSTSLSRYATDNLAEREFGIRIGTRHFTGTLAPKQSGRSSDLGVYEPVMHLILRCPGSLQALKSWEIERGARLTTRLTGIVVEMLLLAETMYRKAAVARRDWWIERNAELVKEIERIRVESERKAKEELERQRKVQIDELLDQARKYDLATQIRAYVADVRRHIAGTSVAPEKLEEWARWALANADHVDPTRNGMALAAIGDVDSGTAG